MNVFFGVSHFEEVVEFSASEWVVSIHSYNALLLLRSFDIPENVAWNIVENFSFS
jgi:hypothetical protein